MLGPAFGGRLPFRYPSIAWARGLFPSMTQPTPSARGARIPVLLTLASMLFGIFAAASPAAPAAAAEDPAWRGEYFANPSLSGTPTLVRDDAQIAFDWNEGSPDPSLPINQFSVRWTRTIDFAAGTYRFTTFSDDGVRLYVDGALRLDKWIDQGPTEWQTDVRSPPASTR